MIKRSSLTGFSKQFTCLRVVPLCIGLMILVLIRLGYWQITRAHEKQALLQQEQQWRNTEPTLWRGGQASPQLMQPLRLEGTFLNQTLLLDNQYYQHLWGYDVLSPLVLDNGVVVLIDRGWVPGDRLRVRFPVIHTPQGRVSVQGRTYFPAQQRWIMGPMLEKKTNSLTIIEHIDPRMVQQFLQKSVYPFIMRLDEHEKGSYVREWPMISMSPMRHYGYAFQWFALAGVLFVLSILLLKKKE